MIVVYYLLYGSGVRPARAAPRSRSWLIIALLGLLYVSVVYSSVFSMAENARAFNRSSTRATRRALALNPNVGAWISRWLHMVTGAVTVGAFLFGWLGRNDEQVFKAASGHARGASSPRSRACSTCSRLGDLLKPFMQSMGIWAMTVGIVLSLGALHFFFKKRFWGAGAMIFVSLALMVDTRHALRLVVLPEALRPATLYADKVAPQWGVFALFLVCFLVALDLVAWMLKTYFTDRTADA